MSKAVLISIQPKWCELIASGKKTVEVRKTKPKLETPFKCYIYCTKAKDILLDVINDGDRIYGETYHGKRQFIKSAEGSICDMYGKRQKVIGEFVCDRIFVADCDRVAPFDKNTKAYIDKESCLSKEEFVKYTKMRLAFGWHISDLKIYDKPKELGEFKKVNRECWYADLGLAKRDCPECKNAECFLQKPPQSWCYVEELSV